MEEIGLSAVFDLTAKQLFQEGRTCEVCKRPFEASSDIVIYVYEDEQWMRVNVTCACPLTYLLDAKIGGMT